MIPTPNLDRLLKTHRWPRARAELKMLVALAECAMRPPRHCEACRHNPPTGSPGPLGGMPHERGTIQHPYTIEPGPNQHPALRDEHAK